MRVVVTGGIGFVGTHFLARLAHAFPDSRIGVIDRIGPTSNPEILETAPLRERVDFFEIDIRDAEGVDRACEGADVLVHLAAETFVDRSLDAPGVFADVNVMGTLNLLRAARRHAIKRFVHVSTDEVFGHLESDGRFDEESPYLPRNPYSASKAASDHFVRAFGATWGLDFVMVHFTNLYGPYQYPEKLIPKAIARLKLGLPIQIYGDGSHVRGWLHVEDAADGLVQAMSRGASGASYIVGSQEECSNLDLARALLEIAGVDPARGISFVADRPGHDFRYAVDCSKARAELRWKPTRDLREGLRQTYAWYRASETWLASRMGDADRRRGSPTGRPGRGTEA